MYRRFFKRVFDIIAAGTGLLLMAPLFGIVALSIYLEDGGPILFRQARPGSRGVPFTLWKFRSMPVNSAQLPSAEARGLRVTRVGRIIRRLNIDELPQLLNILAGHMSVVGPRPPLLTQYDLISLRKANGAWECRPGLTGLAQVNGYDGMSVAEKAEFDGRYSQQIEFLADLAIIARTVLYLFRKPPTY